MADLEFLGILGLGFLLGARHAFDADHIAAVSTILARRPTLRASGFVGFCWGFGHTLMLLLVGVTVIVLNVTIPDAVAQGFEFGVGTMLVLLGGSLAWSVYSDRWHLHRHEHDGTPHVHLHRHEHEDHGHRHWMRASMRPVLVGMCHGLAGSAALMLMILSSIHSVWQGVAYIAVFGLGSVVGMVVIGVLISVPLVWSASFGARAHRYIQTTAGLASAALGVAIMIRIGLGEGVSP
ncbi:HoxN/HupN/NixA family nickel/cobalt transporter [Candidatus Nitrospira bockiana]